MKKSIAIILFILFHYSSNGQYKEVPVNVFIGGDLFLNGAFGASRATIAVNLPTNTVRWYYTITAFRKKEDIERIKSNFNLLGQLTKIYDRSGLSAAAVSLITAPSGSDYCNIYYLCSYNDGNIFRDKPLSTCNYFPNNSAKHAITWKQEITDDNLVSGVQYIGIENPSLAYGINVNIQVVAIVQEPVTDNGWTADLKQDVHDVVKQMLIDKGALNKTTDDKLEAFLTCFIDYVKRNYTPEQYNSLAGYEKTDAIKNGFSECKHLSGIK
ncbi:hypothetical protein CJD36_010900 [Flavipsychrobacter stenotrophus]|uniref:Uncharacterized protein n=1 Tax=Flavipsychrobacter stenotrophus TaxID=2077091 RepID=A0A2S7SVB9_9BACT|nr:hypothetical protein [Flavipsychrobacter stenotrophus]PQJ10476.1 hypothetical protein CJD36_010900 [Flavipsychrobacter stenotrophus]